MSPSKREEGRGNRSQLSFLAEEINFSDFATCSNRHYHLVPSFLCPFTLSECWVLLSNAGLDDIDIAVILALTLSHRVTDDSTLVTFQHSQSALSATALHGQEVCVDNHPISVSMVN